MGGHTPMALEFSEWDNAREDLSEMVPVQDSFPPIRDSLQARVPAMVLSVLLLNGVESHVTDTVFVPVTVVEVPPLEFVDRESFRFHRSTQ